MSSAAPRFRSSDVVLLVTGLVGSGRSTFVNALLPSSLPKAKVGDEDSLAVCTKDVKPAVIELDAGVIPQCKKQYRLIVVDTPGFDDPDQTDAAVLQQIIGWLEKSFPNGKCRGGVVYLHDVSEARYQTVAQSDLEALDRSLKPGLYHQLIIATTKWNRCSNFEEAEKRHERLQTHWNTALSAGSQVYSFREEKDAWDIVNQFLPTIEQAEELDISKGFAEIKRQPKHHSHILKGDGPLKVFDRLVGILGQFSSGRVGKW
ncbi:hypothetical protein H1R20_g2461, partial [Candolleomyces eurysporus]